MPVSPRRGDKPPGRMHVENISLRPPRRHLEFFLPARPYKGEPPTVAGALLYPDTPAKMETTSREAFCFRPLPQQDGGKGDRPAQNVHGPHPTSPGPAGGEKRDTEGALVEERQGGSRGHTEDGTEMQSQYQKDFPPPTSCRRRRTPALPQPDNIGINPAFRIEFGTVQRETYPGWPISNRRMRAASPGEPNAASEQQSASDRG